MKLILALTLLAVSPLLAEPAKRLLVPTTMKTMAECQAATSAAAASLEASLGIKTLAKCEKYDEGGGVSTFLFSFAFEKMPPKLVWSETTSPTYERVPVAYTVTEWEYYEDEIIPVQKTKTRYELVQVSYGTLANCTNRLQSFFAGGAYPSNLKTCLAGQCITAAAYCTQDAATKAFRFHFVHARRVNATAPRAHAVSSSVSRAPAQRALVRTNLYNQTICDTNATSSIPWLAKFLGTKVGAKCVRVGSGGAEEFLFSYEIAAAKPGLFFTAEAVVPVDPTPKKTTETFVEYSYIGDTDNITKKSVTETFLALDPKPISYGDQIACDKAARDELAAGTHPAFAQTCQKARCAPIAAYCDYEPQTALYSYRFHYAWLP